MPGFIMIGAMKCATSTVAAYWEDHPNVYMVSACSGHGFKFAPALGELVAHEVLDQTPSSELAPFRLSRFKQDPGAAVRPN